MITADQLLAHGIGDYILQSNWMATEKTKQSLAAAVHAITYSLPFLFFRPSWLALAIICSTHFVIDRWRLARVVIWLKNFLSPRNIKISLPEFEGLPDDMRRMPHSVGIETYRYVRNQSWEACKATGYAPDVPPFLAVWLLIIADNLMHITLNGLALKYL
jgi:hypothetical protein